MNRGTIISGVGHVGLILWVVLGDWLFAPSDMPEIAVTEVSLISNAAFDAMVSAAPAKPAPPPVATTAPATETQPDVTTPAPDTPAPDPSTEPLPDTVPIDAAPQPDQAPDPIAPIAAQVQPIPVPASDQKPMPRPIERVAPLPVETTQDAPAIAETVTPEVTDVPSPEPLVVPENPPAAPQEATTQIVTEAVQTEANAPQLAPTASRRPQSRPEKPVLVAANDQQATDVTAALAEAQTVDPPTETVVPDSPPTDSPPTDSAASGPPMTGSDKEALKVAVKACWELGSVSSDAMRTTVVVGLNVARDGKPMSESMRLISFEGGTQASADLMYGVARRAILRCGKKGFPLPPEKYDSWKELELVFDPNGMRLR